MNKNILFIQGGDEGGYETDKALVASLDTALGKEYEINYPEMPSEESAPDFGWIQQICEKIAATQSEVILVGHSLGASMILKYLSENTVNKKITGIFLIATPFWSGDEDWKQGLKLSNNFADQLPDEIPIFFYQSKDDEVVPFSHLNHYKQKVTQATFREIESGGHQLNNDLTLVANDIQSLQNKL